MFFSCCIHYSKNKMSEKWIGIEGVLIAFLFESSTQLWLLIQRFRFASERDEEKEEGVGRIGNRETSWLK